MRVDDYIRVLKFENFCDELYDLCEKVFGKPDKYVLDTNNYFFIFDKIVNGNVFRLCIDSSVSYCYPDEPQIYIRFIYYTTRGRFYEIEFPPINIKICTKLLKKCKKEIKRAEYLIEHGRFPSIWETLASLLFLGIDLIKVGFRKIKDFL